MCIRDSFNHAFEKLTGLKEAEVLGQSLNILFPPALAEKSMAIIRLTSTGERWETEEIEILHSDKSIRTVLWNSATLFASDGVTPIATIAQGNDITKRKLAEETLQKERLLFRTLIDNIPDAIYSKDLHCRKTLANVTEIGYMGAKSEAEVIGKDDFAFYPKEMAERFYADDQYVIQSGKPVLNREEYVYDENGKKKWLLSSKIPLRDKDNQIIGLVGIGRDITERKLAEETIANERLLLRTLIDNIPDLIYLKDLEGRKTLANLTEVRFTGAQSEAEVLGKDDFAFFTKEIAAKFSAEDHEVMQSGKAMLNTEGYIFDRNGKKRWVLSSKIPLRDKDNNIIGLAGISRDITERKLADEALRESEEKYRLIFENSPLGLLSFDEKGVLINCNGRFADILDTTIEKLVGLEMLQLKDEILVSCVQKALSGEFGLYDDVYQSVNTQKKVPVRALFTPIDLGDGNFRGGVGIVEDVSARKQSEEALRMSEEKYRAIFENVQDVFYQTDLAGIVLEVSPSIKHFAEFNRDEIIGQPVYNLYHNPDDRVSLLAELQNKGELRDYELILKTKTGAIKYVSINASLIIGADGQPHHIDGAIRDITERKQAEVALHESGAIYRNLVQKMPDGVYKSTPEGKFVDVNMAMVNMLGYESKEDLMAINIKEQLYFEPTDRESLVLKEQLEEMGVYRLKKKDGSEIWVEDHGWYNTDEKGTILFHEGIMRDITERKLFEQAQKIILEISEISAQPTSLDIFLKAVHQKVNTILPSNNFYVALYDRESDTYNFPYHQDEFDTLFPEKQYNIVNGYTDFVRKTGNTQIITEASKTGLLETNGVNVYGAAPTVWLGVPIKIDNQDNAVGVIAIHDYTKVEAYSEAEKATLEIIANSIGKFIERVKYVEELKIAKEKAEESELKARIYFDHAPDGICIVDSNGHYLDVNQEFSELFGYSKDEMLHKINIPLVVKDDYAKARNVNGKLLSEGYCTEEFLFLRKDGSAFSGLMSSVKVSENQFLSFIKNINVLKKIEQELLHAKEKAEESDKLKSAFLANMSHEIRTPMNGILGFAELLKTPNLSGDEQQQYIAIIKKSGDRMLNIINDIVDISKIEAGQVKVFVSETKINEQTEFLYAFFKPEVERKGMQLILRNGLPDKAAIIKTDKEKVYAVLTNLIKNAIKFTKTGSIEIGYIKNTVVSVATEHAPSLTLPQLEFYVKDSGSGIPKDRQQAIFDRFVQADIADTRALQGAGLGLSISKAYVEMLGGKMWVESEDGQGSIFYFTIPFHTESGLNAINQTTMANEENNQIRKLKILIVEDDETSEMLISIALRSLSKEVLKVKTGIDAIETCRLNPDIDLIMMDVKMPEMDGYEATRQIRKFNKDVCIIAQTAFGLIDEKEKALLSGCNDYISKPLDIAYLKSLMLKHFTLNN